MEHPGNVVMTMSTMSYSLTCSRLMIVGADSVCEPTGQAEVPSSVVASSICSTILQASQLAVMCYFAVYLGYRYLVAAVTGWVLVEAACSCLMCFVVGSLEKVLLLIL